GYYRQTVTLTDAGSTVLSAPLSLVLPGLSPNAQLANRSGGTTGSANPASPYVNVLQSGSLAPGQAASVTLEFINPSQTTITYGSLSVRAGIGSR
ncbi:MAG TPA: hypothetical protein VGD78_16160, partial [Chthoniobacterales bacterium]